MKYVLMAGGYVLCSSRWSSSYKPVELTKISPLPFGRKAMVFRSTEEAAELHRNLTGFSYYDLVEWAGHRWKGRVKKVKMPKRARIFRNTKGG